MAETINLGIVGIKNMGEYDAETNYEKLNVVTYQGSTYCALKDTVGNLPTNTEYWQLYAQKGDKGDTGDTGDTGATGPRGPKGDPSGAPLPAASTADMTDTTKVYVNTTDGHWYSYNGESWEDGGVYQATALADFSVNAKKTNFLESTNMLCFERPAKIGYSLTGTGSAPSSFSISKAYNRYISIIPVESNTDYTLFFTRILESNVNYFKMLSFTETKDEILEYMETHNSLNGTGSFFYDAAVPKNFTTGANDKTVVIQFSNNTDIEYAELLKGTYSVQKFHSFDECLDIFKFSAYNKEETKDLINNCIGGVIDNSYIIDQNFEGVERIDGYLVGETAPQANANYYYYKFTADKDFYCYFDFDDYKNKLYLNLSLFNGSIDGNHFLSRNRYNINVGGSDNNLPNVNNKLFIKSGTVITITEHRSDSHDFKMYTDYEIASRMKEDVGLTKTQRAEVNEIVLDSEHQINKYSLANNELTIIGQKVKYIFKKIVNNSINLNTWRLYSGHLLDDDGEIFAEMWSNSDAEGPIKISGEQDFVGGYHGDEIMTDLKITVDGNLIDHTSNIPESYFSNITIVCKSNVYHCNTSAKANIIAFERTKKLVFEKNKVTVTNNYVVKDDDGFTINRAAIALFQCKKQDYEQNMLINYVNTNSDLNLYPVSMEGSQMPTSSRAMKESYFYTTAGVIKQKITEGYTVGTYNPFVEDYVEQYRLKTYFCYDNFNVVKNQILLSEFEWEIV